MATIKERKENKGEENPKIDINEVLESKEFHQYIDKYILRYNNRPPVMEGSRYIRTPWDFLVDRGEFNTQSIINHFIRIANKVSDLPSNVRKAISDLCTYNLQLVLKDRYIANHRNSNNDGKEESGN